LSFCSEEKDLQKTVLFGGTNLAEEKSNSLGLVVHFLPMPKPERQYKVGDRVQITLHTGRIVDGVVKAVVTNKDGTRLQVDYGKDETAQVELWRVHPAK